MDVSGSFNALVPLADYLKLIMAWLVDKYAIYIMKKLRLSPSKLTPDGGVLIVYISGYGSYSRLHLVDGKRYLYSDSIVCYADRLPGFIRVHKHYLINPHFVESVTQIDSTHGYVTMIRGDQLPIARRRIPQVRKAICAALASRSVAIQP